MRYFMLHRFLHGEIKERSYLISDQCQSHPVMYFHHQKIKFNALRDRGKTQVKEKSTSQTKQESVKIMSSHKLQNIPISVHLVPYGNKLSYNSSFYQQHVQVHPSAWDSIPDLSVKCNGTWLQRHVGYIVADWLTCLALLKR